MEQKNKKILAVSIVVLVIIAFALVMMILQKNKKTVISPPIANPKAEESQEQEVEEETEFVITEEKKAQVAAIRNITGKITAIEVDSISVAPTEGEKLTLKVPQKGANFSSLTKQADGSFIVKEIGLFEIPKDKEVEIQYNSTTNEVTMVGVR